MPENAVKAYTQLDGTTFQGRLLHLIPGKAKLSEEELAEKEGISLDNTTSSFKKQKSIVKTNYSEKRPSCVI